MTRRAPKLRIWSSSADDSLAVAGLAALVVTVGLVEIKRVSGPRHGDLQRVLVYLSEAVRALNFGTSRFEFRLR